MGRPAYCQAESASGTHIIKKDLGNHHTQAAAAARIL